MTSPSVELHFNPTDLQPRDLPPPGAFLSSPAEALEAALSMVRARMVAQMKAEVRGLTEPTYGQLLRLADMTWQVFLPQYRKVSAPVIADAYVRAWSKVDAGDVPMSVIYDLAEKHAEKVGDYFHASSRDALADGFNTMVNRRVPAKAAADKVLDAYGLTPRQMRAYAHNQQLVTAIDSPAPLDVKAKSRDFIDKSFTGRVKKLAEQEEHNINEQAKQFAWMWLQDKGRLNERAQKVWITARDERVCPVCGPLHGQRVLVGEQFKTRQGVFWSPGVHPNCRCVVRLIENRFRLEKRLDISKADWDAEEHPRGGDPENKGRFSRVAVKERPQAAIWQQLATTKVEPEVKPEPAEPVIEVVSGDAIEVVSRTRPRRSGQIEVVQSAIEATPKAAIEVVQAPVIEAVATPVIDPVASTAIEVVAADPKLELIRNTRVDFDRFPKQPEGKPDLAPKDKFVDIGEGHNYYTVIHESDYDTDMNMIKRRFTNSAAEASSIATEMREDKLQELLDIVTGSRRNKTVPVTGIHPETGETMYADVDPNAYAHALRRVAEHAQPAHEWDEMEIADSYEDVSWRDAAGNEIAEDFPYIEDKDLVEQSGVHPNEFHYRILSVKKGHADENSTKLLGRGKVDLSGQFVEAGPTTSMEDNEGRSIPVTPIRPYG